MDIQVIQSNKYDWLKFSYKLRSFFLSGPVLEFDDKATIFLEKEQFEVKKEQNKKKTG